MDYKKQFHGLAVLCSTLMLSSCAALGFGPSLPDISRIHQGQTPKEVVAAMNGEPRYRRFTEDGLEEWEYRRNQQLDGDCDVVVISFRDGRVVALDSFPYVYPKTPKIEAKP